MIIVYSLFLAGLAGWVVGQTESPACQGPCRCQRKESRFKVECSNVESISSLDLPALTTQLSITGRLTRIGRDDLSALVKLDKLNLSGNAISVIEDGAFSKLLVLTKLDLSNNKLVAINNSMFAGLTKLKRLALSGNLISTLPENVFDPLSELTRIDFDSPNLQCNCQLKWIIKWISSTTGRVSTLDTKCAGPSNLKSLLVRNLNRENLKCDWPVDLKVFELQPSARQLVYAGDSLPINCRVSSATNFVGVYWYRLGKQVVTNSSAKIEVTTDSSQKTLVILTLTLQQLTTDKSGSWSCIAETADGNVTKSITVVVAPAFCEQKIEDTDKGQYVWPKAGFSSRSEQPCKDGSNGAKAFYTCNNQGQWVDLDLRACKYNNKITQLLKELSIADFNLTTNMNMVKTIVEYTEYIKDKMDVILVSRVLRRISGSYYLYARDPIAQIVYNITSLMMNVNSSLLLEAEKEEKVCTRMLENLETVMGYVLQHNVEFNLHMDNIAVQARKVSKNLFIGLTCIANQYGKEKKTYLPSNFYCNDEASSPDLANSKNQKVDAMIHIPAEVAAFDSNSGFFKLVVMIYRNDKLFQIVNKAQNSSKYFMPSSVISASIIGLDVKNLPVPITLALPRQDYISSVPNVRAVYWDKAEYTWRSNGCRIFNTIEQANHNLSIVECDHMSSYTLLQERVVARPAIEKSVEVFSVLKPQFYVGAVFLCICLLAIISTYTYSYRTIGLSRKLRHSLVNTCFSILHLKIIFILGVRINPQHMACQVVGMAIHYFSLTTILWITVTTWNIYKKISGRGHHRVHTEEGTAPLPPNPMLKFYLFAWGIPVIICGITGAVNIKFYGSGKYCFVALEPGLLAYYGVVGLFILVNCILYICICSTKREPHTKVYMDEMVVLNSDGCFEPHHIDDTMSNTGSIKSSEADSEYRPLAQLTGIIIFLILYLFMWASGAFSIWLLTKPQMEQLDIILSFLYMILCIILGIFLVAFYCLARNDTRSTWHSCCRTSGDPIAQPPRSSTNINVISHANAHSSLKRDDDSTSSLKTSSVNNPSNPLLQIMQYHKKTAMMSHSIAGSQSRGDASAQGSPEDVPVFFNPRQNGVAKKYWERKRTSREHGMNSSMMSVPETSRHQTHSPTNTEPTQHMSIEIQIKSHSSKQARRHRLGSTNSEPADVRNNIYHSMPKSPHQLNMPSSRRREPTIGQSKTPSEGSRDNSQFSRYPADMWQNSAPREYKHTSCRSSPHVSAPPLGAYVKQPAFAYERGDSHRKVSAEALNKQSYVQSYVRSMKDTDNSDDDSRYSHRSRRSSQHNRQRPRRHRHQPDSDHRQLVLSPHNESHMSLQSPGTARSHHSSRSARSAAAHRHNGYRITPEEKPLLPSSTAQQSDQQLGQQEEEEKLNINHSSSDNNSSHYACAPILEAKTLNTHKDLPPRQQAVGSAMSVFSALHQDPYNLTVDTTGTADLNPSDLIIPEERIYENAHKIMQHERPVYTNLEELRLQAAAKHSPRSPELAPDEYELPVYENLFSLNEYDTLKKQKHNVNKGLPLLQSGPSQGSRRNLQSSSHSDVQNHDSSL